MNIAYTLTEGRIKCEEIISEIKFALIFESDGVITIDAFVSDKDFFEKTKNSSYYSLEGLSEKGYNIECHDLFCSSYSNQNHKAKFNCNNKIVITDNRDTEGFKEEEEELIKDIFFIELDGLKTKFANYTYVDEYRSGAKVDKILNYNFDHTSCSFIFNHTEINDNYFSFSLIENPTNGNIIIDFRNQVGYSNVTEKVYELIKLEFLSLLSFINGSNVRIRKELKGYHYTDRGNNNFDSQEVSFYSFKKTNESNFNSYFPINEHHVYSNEIFLKMFTKCFDNFYHSNKTLDFESLIFSLNSTNSININERYFILITALEKICTNYANNLEENSNQILDNEIYNLLIKPKFKELLDEIKNVVKFHNKTAWSIYSSKIGDLNRKNLKDTKQKIYEFLGFANIKINDEVTSLVEKERNHAVHEGVIGDNNIEEIYNYLKLDHLLRDCIANIIGYDGRRNRKYDYDK